jgi:peroxin-6
MAAVLKDCIDGLAETWKSSAWPVIVIGTTGDVDKVPAAILGTFKEDIVITVRPPPPLSPL